MRNLIIGLICGLAIMAGALLLTTPPRTVAQTPTNSLGELLLELDEAGTLATLEFDKPVARLGRSVDLGNDSDNITLERVGPDMACFGLRSNNVTQVSCVPYSNIIQVFYSE